MTDIKGKSDSGMGGKILHFPQGPAFYAKRGDAKRAQNDPVNAIAMYNEALKRDSGDTETRLAAAQVLTDMSRFNDSNRLLIPYMHTDDLFKLDAYCIVGFNLMGMGEFEGAKGCFNRFLDMTDEVSDRTDAILDALDYIDSVRPEEPLLEDAAVAEFEDTLDLAHERFDRSDFDGSARLLRELNDKEPDDKQVLYDLALACLCTHENEEGERHIDHLLEIDPEHWRALGLKLMFARAKNDELEIKRVCKRLEKCDSELPEELLRINGALLETGCYDLALRFAERLAKQLPYDTLVNHRLAVSLIALGRYKKAADVYDKLMRIDSKDFIARYHRARCLEALEGGGFAKEKPIIQYQLPFDRIIEMAKKLLDNKGLTADQIMYKWDADEDFRETVRWAFTLHEFNITHAMLNLLRAANDNRAQHLVREVMADVDAGRTVVNDAMGILKRMGAPEPFFAVVDGSLLEGRVNIIDLSDVRIPKQYCDIFPRFAEKAGQFYSGEVMNTAATIVERFIANTRGVFKRLTNEQSAALSAAVEYLACNQCGIPARDDVAERYGVTHRRIMNAINRIVTAVLNDFAAGDMNGEDPE